jgi:hypothetical protein
LLKAIGPASSFLTAEAHDSYLQKLLHKTLLADEQNSAKLHGAMPTQQGVQVELRYLLQLTLDLKPRIQSLSEMVKRFLAQSQCLGILAHNCVLNFLWT